MMASTNARLRACFGCFRRVAIRIGVSIERELNTSICSHYLGCKVGEAADRQQQEDEMATTMATTAMANQMVQRQDGKAPPRWKSRHPLGHLPAIHADPLAFFTEAHARFGDVVDARAATVELTTLANPDDWQKVLVSEREAYSKNTRGYDKLKLVLGEGLVTSEGHFWRRQRRIAQPAFHRRRIEAMGETFSACAAEEAMAWRSAASVGASIDVSEAMMALTLRIVGLTLFSLDIRGESARVGEDLGVLLHEFSRVTQAPYPYPERLPTLANWRFWRSRKRMRALVDAIIAQRRARGEVGDDLLGMLMGTEDADTGERMSDTELRDEVLTMLLAGHETTANALAWTFWLLATHPEERAAVQAELDAVLGDRGPTMADVPRLQRTSAAIDEAMRLYPPVWILGRRTEREVEVSGYRLPAGRLVFLSPYALHRNPKIWDAPDAFRPERFVPDPETGKVALPHKMAYAPFSAGQRKCIGDHFARTEAAIILATLLREHDVVAAPGQTVQAEPTLTLRPRGGLPLTIRRR